MKTAEPTKRKGGSKMFSTGFCLQLYRSFGSFLTNYDWTTSATGPLCLPNQIFVSHRSNEGGSVRNHGGRSDWKVVWFVLALATSFSWAWEPAVAPFPSSILEIVRLYLWWGTWSDCFELSTDLSIWGTIYSFPLPAKTSLFYTWL